MNGITIILWSKYRRPSRWPFACARFKQLRQNVVDHPDDRSCVHIPDHFWLNWSSQHSSTDRRNTRFQIKSIETYALTIYPEVQAFNPYQNRLWNKSGYLPDFTPPYHTFWKRVIQYHGTAIWKCVNYGLWRKLNNVNYCHKTDHMRSFELCVCENE